MSAQGVIRHVHSRLGFAVELPEGSEVREDTDGVALLALEPVRDAGFRSNLAITVDALEPDVPLDRYTDAALELQDRTLHDFVLLDRGHALVGGRPATRTLAHHDLDGLALCIEQWRLVDGRDGWTVTATAWALDYDEVADALAAGAESLELP